MTSLRHVGVNKTIDKLIDKLEKLQNQHYRKIKTFHKNGKGETPDAAALLWDAHFASAVEKNLRSLPRYY